MYIVNKSDGSILMEVSSKEVQESENAIYIVVNEVEYKQEGFKSTIIYEYSKDKYYLQEEV